MNVIFRYRIDFTSNVSSAFLASGMQLKMKPSCKYEKFLVQHL